MSGIGHNQPPEPIDPFAALATHIEDLIELAEGALHGNAIETPEQAEQIEALKVDIKKAAKDADAARAAEKKPHDEAGKAVQAKWKPLLDRADIAAKTAAAALTPWLQKVQAEKEAEQQRLRDEAAKLEAEAQAKMKASAPTDLSARMEAEEALKLARKATAGANRIDRSATGLRTYWTGTVTDPGAFLAWLKTHRAHELKAWLAEQAQKEVSAGQRQMAGVLIQDERRVA